MTISKGTPSKASPESSHSERFDEARMRLTAVEMRAMPPNGALTVCSP